MVVDGGGQGGAYLNALVILLLVGERLSRMSPP